ncbi:MAG: hypothetical protein LBR80_04525 [Deltaproteobacteria bacterium]|nr:hypothetical protein [Deltaproteobacteria bacterium]
MDGFISRLRKRIRKFFEERYRRLAHLVMDQARAARSTSGRGTRAGVCPTLKGAV